MGQAPEAERPPEGRDDEGRVAPSERLASAERRVRGEASAERKLAKEKVAETIWEKPKHFVEWVIQKKIGPSVRRFLGHFGSLDDEAMATDALKKARDEAKREAERQD